MQDRQILALWIAIVVVAAWGEYRAHQRVEQVQIHRYEFVPGEFPVATEADAKAADVRKAKAYYDGRYAPAGAMIDRRPTGELSNFRSRKARYL